MLVRYYVHMDFGTDVRKVAVADMDIRTYENYNELVCFGLL